MLRVSCIFVVDGRDAGREAVGRAAQNAPVVKACTKKETPLGAAGGVSGDCYQVARFLMPLL